MNGPLSTSVRDWQLFIFPFQEAEGFHSFFLFLFFFFEERATIFGDGCLTAPCEKYATIKREQTTGPITSPRNVSARNLDTRLANEGVLEREMGWGASQD